MNIVLNWYIKHSNNIFTYNAKWQMKKKLISNKFTSHEYIFIVKNDMIT